jgi:hypothetical protein
MLQKYNIYLGVFSHKLSIFKAVFVILSIKMKILKKKLRNFTLNILLISLLLNCSKIDPQTGEKVLIEVDPKKRAEKAVEEGKGIFGNILRGGSNQTGAIPSFANSNVLWKATLKSLEFLPLANTDYAGGLIIYDWYSRENNPQEQIKLTIRFLSDELRSDSVSIIAHKKICDNFNRCSDAKIEQQFVDTIKENIITSARKLKIEEAKKSKN